MANPETPPDPFTDLRLALPYIEKWEDCGLEEIRYWRVWAKCSAHGVIWATWDVKPVDGELLSCGACVDPKRKCLIYAYNPAERPL